MEKISLVSLLFGILYVLWTSGCESGVAAAPDDFMFNRYYNKSVEAYAPSITPELTCTCPGNDGDGPTQPTYYKTHRDQYIKERKLNYTGETYQICGDNLRIEHAYRPGDNVTIEAFCMGAHSLNHSFTALQVTITDKNGAWIRKPGTLHFGNQTPINLCSNCTEACSCTSTTSIYVYGKTYCCYPGVPHSTSKSGRRASADGILTFAAIVFGTGIFTRRRPLL